MGLTKSEAIANHRKMWRWIAEETLKQERKVEKWEYFKTLDIMDRDMPFGDCYCCEYAFNEDYTYCRDCPIDWGGEFGTCKHRDIVNDNKGLYALWCDELDDYIKAAELAKKIAELPERKYGGDFSALLT